MKMNKKISVLLCGMTLAALSASAGDVAMKVTLTDGQTTTFVLEKRPSVTFDGQEMNIACDGVSTSFVRTEVQDIRFAEESGVADLVKNSEVIRYINGTLEAPGNEIEFYSLDGRLVARGYESVSTADLESAVYVVRAGKQTLKILVK